MTRGDVAIEPVQESQRPRPAHPLEALAALLPVEDLVQSCCSNADCATCRPVPRRVAKETIDVEQLIVRMLHRRRERHVLLTGRRGVGKSAALRSLARSVGSGQFPFLSEHRFIRIDCSNVGPEDSRACLESIFTAITTMGGVVLCLDGLGALLKRTNGSTNKPLLRAMISRGNVLLIGVMSDWEYNDLVGGDADMMDYFTRIEIDEPNEETSIEIARRHAGQLSEQFELQIGDHVVERTVALASTFVLNECHPAKSVNLLRRVCEDGDYERTQSGVERFEIVVDDVVRAIAEKTGIPVETISGDTEEHEFEATLRDAVVGQDQAIAEVANELRLIKSGLTEPDKPAAVLLFAGMTGVGKTELAKRIAELYSTSRRLNVYTLGNFTEPHTVSGIIGVPPGYVGHEEGGRLINELNADPYSVVLLDEAEKCHPNIWKPFLNLFDEGWIVDQRGVKAHADRAIIILTTNAGERNVAQMAKSGKPPEEIAERVKQALSKVRHERSSQPVFPPQFLSRIKRIIVFNPLDEAAMIGIAERTIARMQRLWLQKREKRIDVPQDLIDAIGRRAYESNEKSNGQEGGRIVKKLVSDLIELRIQHAATERSTEYKACSIIRLSYIAPAKPEDGAEKTPTSPIQIDVEFVREMGAGAGT